MGPFSDFAKVATCWVAISLAASVGAFAGDGDGPELTSPSEMPGVSKPAKPSTTSPKVGGSTGRRAVLALPGITTPSTRPVIESVPSTPSPDPGAGELSLDAPIEMRGLPASAPTRPTLAPDRSTRPLVLESSPMEDADPLPRPNPSARRATANPRTDPQPVPAPARRTRLFGLFPGASTATTPSIIKTPTPGRSSVDDAREDPAVDSALKRRIEKQARDAVGDRARSVEVRVLGKSAMVQARGVKFYQKRAVRKSLETIPALSGLRSTIEVND